MKMRIGLHRIVFALTVITTIAASAVVSAEETNSPATIPLIVMDNVPLSDAIRNLARQAGLNFILDPRLPGNSFGANGKWTPPPNVSVRWENITAREALDRVLKEHDLVLVDNPATGVARIAPKDLNVKPVPSTAVDTNSPVIPLIIMTDMPLDEAIKHLAQSAKLDVVLDPKVSNPMAAEGRPMPQPTVSVRWEDITGRQALAAVLDNYDLVMKTNPAGAGYQILPKSGK